MAYTNYKVSHKHSIKSNIDTLSFLYQKRGEIKTCQWFVFSNTHIFANYMNINKRFLIKYIFNNKGYKTIMILY